MQNYSEGSWTNVMKMKATSSKGENRKRRRDDSEEIIQESVKKAKVHAQRKFAQGAGFYNNNMIAPIREKIRAPNANPTLRPMIVGKSSNAGDFLTFLCFRKYGVPSKGITLTTREAREDTSTPATSSSSSDVNENSEDILINNGIKEKEENGNSNEKDDGDKKSSPGVQALREKYQEQRLAKQKVSNVTKLALKVKGKNMMRTRSSGVAVQEMLLVARKQATVKPAKPILGLRSGLRRIKPVVSPSAKKDEKPKLVRSGLRSGSGGKAPDKVSTPTKSINPPAKKTEKELKKPKVEVSETKTKNLKVKKPEGFSDFSSDDNEPLSTSKKPKIEVKKPEKSSGVGRPPGKSSVKTRAQTSEMESKTRAKTAAVTSAVVRRPTRRTKEAATVYMEILTKKLVNTKKSGSRGGGGLSDESSSSSYLELPNVKKTEQRENEIKAKALAAKATKTKLQNEDKTKEGKKGGNKKEEPIPKKETKAAKEEPTKKPNQNVKGDTKGSAKSEEISAVMTRRGSRSSAKEEPPKGKPNTQEKPAVQATRPSTRSRPQEEPEPQSPKKSAPKPPPQTKDVKGTQNKVAPEKQTTSKVDTKSKEKKVVAKGLSQKSGAEEKQGSLSKASSLGSVNEQSGKQEQKGKKTVEKGKQVVLEKKESKEKQEKAKEPAKDLKKDPKGKKPGDGKQEKKEPEVKKTVEKKKSQERTEKENPISRRPTRNCSSVDKIWIDIDGFTSDEDDFIDDSARAKTRASAKKAAKDDSKEKPKAEESKKPTKTEKSSSGKGKNEKAQETEKEEKHKKEEVKKGDAKTAEKESKKQETVVGKQKSVTKTAETKEKEKPKEKEVTKGKEKVAKDEKSDKKEKVEESKSSTKSKNEKKSVREASKGKEEESEEGGRTSSFRRTRPVRQCSTGEKKWIESDSDSFSFYSSSEEETEASIRGSSEKSNVKSSLEETNAKEKETGIPEGSKKGSKKSSKGEDADHFSESDEEPLEKKVVTVKKTPETKSPSCGAKSDVVGEKSPGKTQREVPGLHPLKKIPSESHLKELTEIGDGSSLPKPNKTVGQPQPNVPARVEPKPPVCETKTPEKKIEPIPTMSPTASKEDVSVVFTTEQKTNPVPNRTDMAFSPVRRDEGTSGNVMVTFGNVPYQPMPCSYHIKPMNFPPSREPISTHGLDLLSEVALPTDPKEKLSSQTERIEKWLKDSLAADHKSGFRPCQLAQYSPSKPANLGKPSPTITNRPDSSFYNGEPAPGPAKVSSHPEHQKFGELELLESQKLLKRNIFAAEMKHEAAKVEAAAAAGGGVTTAAPASHSPPAKKAVTSVQDLLKLQKERKEMGKSPVDNSPHLKNCKCNNCVVKKGWFKNKPVPSTTEQKTSPKEESAKPFQSLTKAFSKTTEEEEEEEQEEEKKDSNSRTSMNVAPMVLNPTPVVSSRVMSTPSTSKDGKGVFQQKKMSFLERMKERERKEMAARKAKVNAFSPSNESSVYAFEPEREQPQGMSTPFKRKARESRTSSTSNSRSDDEVLKICEDESSTASSGMQQQEKTVHDTSGSSKASQSASIAVQVNLDSEVVAEVEPPVEGQDGKSIEISTQTEVPEEDSDSPLFYIPLQQGTSVASTSSDQQVIQGLTLKLGTDGPMGPNQRLIMKAKLVTKAPEPSITAMVVPQPKRLFDQKNSNPPIGTVQPTARKPPTVEDSPTNQSPESARKVPGVSKNETSKEAVSQTSKESSSESSTPKTSKQSPKTPTASPSSSSSGGKGKEKSNQTPKTETSEDQSSPSSSKGKKATKQRTSESISPSNSFLLSPEGNPSELVEAPTFYPTEKDFQDPFEFFDRIRPAAEKFGLCRIVPPSSFKPDCKVSDDMRFTAYNQYVSRMFHRWGPNIKEMMAIKKYLATQSISLKQPPWIGGIEVDLPRLYQSVQNCGGLMKVMEKKKWHQVADMMKIPKAAQDRVTKLDDIYCKYLLPYDTLSQNERQKLFVEVEKDWRESQKKPLESQDTQGDEEGEEENYIEECEECVVKGRNMALNQFYRIARNTMSMWFRNPEPSPREVESEFWKHVSERNHHVCVHSGSIDSRGWGYGFPIAKNNSFSRHPWNLKVLTNNSGSVLRSLGPVMGVTVPTIHVGMVFTAFCWYRDPHGLPWIEYLHTGAPKIWYGISDDNSTVFQEALTKLLPRYIKDKRIWLPSDTAMIPPNLLVENGVSLCHTIQEPGQFILVFPRAFTSSICTGYLVSESVYFAQPSWLSTAEQVFKDIQESCEPTMFSLEKLLFSIATDSRSSLEVLKQVLPMVWHVKQKEIDGRKTLSSLGLKSADRLPSKESANKKGRGRWPRNEEEADYECEVCRMNLYVSLVTNSHEEGVYCLPHAIDLLTQKRQQLKFCKLMYNYTQAELTDLVENLKERIEIKSQKKIQSKALSTSGGK